MNVTYLSFHSKRRFGVELEVNQSLNPEALAAVVNKVLGKRQHCYSMGWGHTYADDGWCVKPDSSCGDLGNKNVDGGGYEVVSSPGKGSKHLDRVVRVAAALDKAGAQTNQYCGLHCHVEIKDFDNRQAAILLAYWCKLEPILSHMVPNHRLETVHCKFFTKQSDKFAQAKQCKDWSDFWEIMKLRRFGAADKRTSLTLINFQRTNSSAMDWETFNRPTVEMRLPEGTLIPHDVKNWIRMFVHFVETVSTWEFPSDFSRVGLEEALEIMGLRSANGFAVLSPGLHETKCWLLYRLLMYSGSALMKSRVLRHWQAMSTHNMSWRYDFPQVHVPVVPKEKKVVRPYVPISAYDGAYYEYA